MIQQFEKKKILILCILVFFCSFITAFILSPLLGRNIYFDFRQLIHERMNFVRLLYQEWRANVGFHTLNGVRWYRIELLVIPGLLLYFGIFFGFKKTFDFVFKYRWLLGIGLLAFLVINKMHGDSFAMYDILGGVQKNHTTQYTYPIFGWPRAIRTDEYIVTNAYKLNQIIRGDFFSLMGMAVNPFLIIAKIISFFGIEYLYSYLWYCFSVIGFLLSIEFFMILTNKNKLVSVTASMMIFLSTFYLWWGFPPHIIYLQGAIVGVYYFVRTESRVGRVFWLYLVGVMGYGFASNLYPAWQVPLAYVGISLFVWILYSNWEYVKRFGKFEYILLACFAVMAIVVVVLYLYTSREYIASIMGAVYPGHRVDYGGSWPTVIRDKGFNYLAGMLFAFKDFDVMNNCESSVLISFFPIPTLLIIFKMIHEKKVHLLAILLLVVLGVLVLYCTIGLPKWVAVISLLSFSMSTRAIDVIGYIQILLLAISFSEVFDKNKKYTNFEKGFGILISLVVSGFVIWFGVFDKQTYLFFMDTVILIFITVVVSVLMINEYFKYRTQILMSILIIVSLITGLYVRPISVGLDSLYAKPLTKKINEIVQKDDGNWLALGGDYMSSIATISGAKTLNMVNTSPNLKLWSKIDSNKKYEDVYNRFAHIGIELTNDRTSFVLNYPDNFSINLNYADLEKLNVDYILSNEKIKYNSTKVKIKQIYKEDGAYIYNVSYK